MCIKDEEIYFFLLKMKKLQMEKKIQLFLIFIFIDFLGLLYFRLFMSLRLYFFVLYMMVLII
jgi:hypothetical protein